MKVLRILMVCAMESWEGKQPLCKNLCLFHSVRPEYAEIVLPKIALSTWDSTPKSRFGEPQQKQIQCAAMTQTQGNASRSCFIQPDDLCPVAPRSPGPVHSNVLFPLRYLQWVVSLLRPARCKLLVIVPSGWMNFTRDPCTAADFHLTEKRSQVETKFALLA